MSDAVKSGEDQTPKDIMDLTVMDSPTYSWPELTEEELGGEVDFDEEEGEEEEESTEEGDESETSEEENDDEWSDDDGDAGENGEDEGKGKTYTEEEYKQLQSSTTKGAQQLLRVIEVSKILATDQEKLLEIHENEPEVAKLVLKSYYEGATIEEFAQDYLWVDYTDPNSLAAKGKTEEEIRADERAKVQAELVAEENTGYLWSLIEETWVDAAQAEAIKEEFNDIVNGRDIDKAKVKKYFQTAYYTVTWKNTTSKEAEVTKKTAPKKWSGWKGTKKKGGRNHIADSIAWLKNNE